MYGGDGREVCCISENKRDGDSADEESPGGFDLSTSVFECGDVTVSDSSNVQIGHNLVYNGPVIIKQYIQSPVDSPPSLGGPSESKHPLAISDAPPVTFNERIKKRGHWFGLPPRGEILPLEVSPVHFVIVGHTAGNTYIDHVTCRNAVRHIQASHFNKDMVDIGYSFLIGGDGFIYEGRGWDKRPALPEMVRSRTLFISLMGDFMFELPLPVQLEALFCLLEEGVRICKLTPDYKILTQKQVAATESPGMAFIEEIRKWPRWGYLD